MNTGWCNFPINSNERVYSKESFERALKHYMDKIKKKQRKEKLEKLEKTIL